MNINWNKWNRLRFIERVKCFFGFHKTEDYEFNHCDDISKHELKCCINCGLFFRKYIVFQKKEQMKHYQARGKGE